ncbi:hypothetical protein ACQPXM_40660 [Kribbella sp. CA-253562]|uniref:hypothetical protein n=1 Tax=Kribbella sp. CA-253562 TaxID=3239942 RepID=UPI003D8B891A
MTRTLVVLGAGGRLGPAVVAAAEHAGYDVLQVGRATGFDAVDSAWQQPERWSALYLSAGVESVAAVVNLVVSKANSADETAAVGRGAVRAAAAAKAAAVPAQQSAGHGLRPDGAAVAVHLGSVAEWRSGPPSAYAAGKIAARQEAQRVGIDVVLTLGVVPRPAGDQRDAALRRLAGRAPSVGALELDVSTAEEAGAAVVRAVSYARDHSTPAEITLAGRSRAVAEVVGVEPVRHWYSGALVSLLAKSPRTSNTGYARLVSLARAASGTGTVGHYRTAPVSSAEQVAVLDGWPVLASGEGLWFVPRSDEVVHP